MTAIAEQEWQQVEARKQRIVAQCERNATLAADQLSERLETEKLSANQLVPVFGVSVAKVLALTGQMMEPTRWCQCKHRQYPDAHRRGTRRDAGDRPQTGRDLGEAT